MGHQAVRLHLRIDPDDVFLLRTLRVHASRWVERASNETAPEELKRARGFLRQVEGVLSRIYEGVQQHYGRLGICRECHAEFVDRSKNHLKQYCSRSCVQRAHSRRHRQRVKNQNSLANPIGAANPLAAVSGGAL